jgi:hypothetical protein
MTTETKTAGVEPEVLADVDALMRHLLEKTSVEPELLRRADERADRVIEGLRQRQVQIDVEKLLREARDDS